jgi:hypothetical protein
MMSDLGSFAQLRCPVVLVDHAAEDLAPLDWQVQRQAGLVVVVGRSLLAGLVRAMPVVMAAVLSQDRAQVPFAVDEHPVGALASCGAYPSLGITVRSRRPRRDLDWRHALAGEDRVKGAGELGVAVPDQEPEGAGPITEVHEEVTSPLGGPRAVRVCCHAEDMHPPGSDLHDEQDVRALEEDRVHMKEITGEHLWVPKSYATRRYS